MKKFFCIVLMLSIASLAAFAQTGILLELTGDVQIKSAESSGFVSAQHGSEIANDTIVSTGFKSTAVISVGNSMITVRPLTRLSLAEIQSSTDAENININLHAGRVKVEVKPPAGARANFTVKSPTATASVRGTVFEFDTRLLKVIEGEVSFIGSSGIAMQVPAGGESFVGSEGNAVDPAEIAGMFFQPASPVGAESGGASGSLSPTFSLSININYQQ